MTVVAHYGPAPHAGTISWTVIVGLFASRRSIKYKLE